jgi:hypothetical protein
MRQKWLNHIPGVQSDNPKPVLSPSTPLRINSVEGSKTCPFDKLGADSERSRRIQNPKWVGVLVILVLLVGCLSMAEAQQPTKIPRIGFLARISHQESCRKVESMRLWKSTDDRDTPEPSAHCHIG